MSNEQSHVGISKECSMYERKMNDHRMNVK